MASILNDLQIADAIRTQRIKIKSRIDLTDKYHDAVVPQVGALVGCEWIQASSIDLHIGRIFEPPSSPVPEQQLNQDAQHASGGWLLPGHTVVVETLEHIKLPPSIGGFGFPPSKVSQNAILTTNPGHVDPGYDGHLTFTLINMGRERYSLRSDKTIVTLLLFELDKAPEADYAVRLKAEGGKPPKMPGLLNRLAPDFANFNARMDTAASEAVTRKTAEFGSQIVDAKHKLDLAQLWIPILGAALGGITVIALNLLDHDKASEQSVRELANRVVALEQQNDVGDLRRRVTQLENHH